MNSLQAGFYIPSTKRGYLQAPLCQGSSVPSRYIWIGWQRSGVYVDLQIKKGAVKSPLVSGLKRLLRSFLVYNLIALRHISTDNAVFVTAD